MESLHATRDYIVEKLSSKVDKKVKDDGTRINPHQSTVVLLFRFRV